MNIEDDLRHALRRTAPAPGLAGRVVRAAAASQVRRPPRWQAIAASLTLTAMLAGWGAHAYLERREGERARDEVLLALRIAGAKVRYAQEHVREIGH